MANDYVSGNRIRLTAVFTDLAGAAVEPTAVQARVMDPDGEETTYNGTAVTRESAGHYHIEMVTEKAGRYYYRFEGTGAVIAADEESFTVRRSQFNG